MVLLLSQSPTMNKIMGNDVKKSSTPCLGYINLGFYMKKVTLAYRFNVVLRFITSLFDYVTNLFIN